MEKNRISTQPSPSSPFPAIAFTKSKIAFDPSLSSWEWDDGVHEIRIYFTTIPAKFGHFVPQLKQCLMVFAAGYSCSYVTNLFNAFLHFARANEIFPEPCSSISTLEVARYRASLADHEAWRLGGLNPLLQKWFDLGLDGIDADCVEDLDGSRKPGNAKGDAVRTRDPVNGPFSDSEFRALFRAVDAAYGAGELPDWVAALFRLLTACGGRIAQYASLKIMDFRSAEGNSNGGSALLLLPEVKTGHAQSRDSFQECDISPQTARVVSDYLARLEAMGFRPNSAMFPIRGVLKDGGHNELRVESDLFYGHCTTAPLRYAFCAALGKIAPYTDRLGYLKIPISPRRFRYTFGTRMAEEGCSHAVIADRLGHADLQNVGVYFEASPLIIENIDKAMSAGLAPIAEAFQGKLIVDESESTFRGAPGSRIIDFRTSTVWWSNLNRHNDRLFQT